MKNNTKNWTESQLGTDKFRLYSQVRSNVEETKEQNKGRKANKSSWTGAIKLAMLGLMLLWATHCPTEVTSEVMGYLVIGIQTVMSYRAQQKKRLLRKSKEMEANKKNNVTSADQTKLQAPDERSRRIRPVPSGNTEERILEAESRLC